MRQSGYNASYLVLFGPWPFSGKVKAELECYAGACLPKGFALASGVVDYVAIAR
jgi:hypothetical protein